MANQPHWAVVHARVYCSVLDCDHPHRVRGLCNKHYVEARKIGTLRLHPKARPARREECSVPECAGVHHSNGLCRKHYVRAARRGILDQYSWSDTKSTEPPSVWHQRCSEPGCGRMHIARGLCTMHYQRERRRLQRSLICSESGCALPVTTRGMCTKHYQRQLQRSERQLLKDGTSALTCVGPGCNRLQFAHRLCRIHFARLERLDALDEWLEMCSTTGDEL